MSVFPSFVDQGALFKGSIMLTAASSRSSPSSATSKNHDAFSLQLRPSVTTSCKSGGGGRIMFPVRLYAMLEDVEASGYSHVVSWQPHGRCFVVHKQHEFARHIVPMYFRQTKWSSFQRQLNIYGFNRLSDGPDKGGYYHPSFLRGQSSLCELITRTTVKGTRVRVASNPNLEPNFYAMSSLDSNLAPDVNACVRTGNQSDSPSMPMPTSSGSVLLQLIVEGKAIPEPKWCTHALQHSHGHHISRQDQSSLGNMAMPSSETSGGASWIRESPMDYPRRNMAQPASSQYLQETPDLQMSFQQEIHVQDRFLGQSHSIILLQKNPFADDSPEDSSTISDDPAHLQLIFSSMGKPFSFDELDELPEDDHEWGTLLESLMPSAR